MIISDLEHLEVASEENNVEGGYANGYAYTYAFASGNNAAITYTTATTNTISGSGYLSGHSFGTYVPYPYQY